MAKNNFFQSMDKKCINLFNDIIQNRLSKINEFIEDNLDEKNKNLAYKIISIFVISLPILIALIFLTANQSAKFQNEQLKNLVDNIERLESEESAIKIKISKLNKKGNFGSPSNVQQQIFSALRYADIEKKNIQIDRLDPVETIGDIEILNVQGTIKEIGTMELTKIFETINKNTPHRLNEIRINKNSQSDLLSIFFDYDARTTK